MDSHEKYMLRCLDLAIKGIGAVAPNPMVGAVLVYKDQIIGEGWHKQYGHAHAEVNCLDDARRKGFEHVFSASQLYVSLEPCAHFGKTPPCADLIIRSGIPHVIIATRDPFIEVNGKGIEKLEAAGIKVTQDVLQKEARHLNRRFFTFHEKKRPYIILKWAQTEDGIIGFRSSEKETSARLMISNTETNVIVHRWRSEEAAIMVGTRTALQDDPQLTNRNWPGSSPLAITIDKQLSLPATSQIFKNPTGTIVFNLVKDEKKENLRWIKLNASEDFLPQIIKSLFELNIQSLLVEGGQELLQTFIDAGLWDEARVITGSVVPDQDSKWVYAPKLSNSRLINSDGATGNTIEIFEHLSH